MRGNVSRGWVSPVATPTGGSFPYDSRGRRSKEKITSNTSWSSPVVFTIHPPVAVTCAVIFARWSCSVSVVFCLGVFAFRFEFLFSFFGFFFAVPGRKKKRLFAGPDGDKGGVSWGCSGRGAARGGAGTGQGQKQQGQGGRKRQNPGEEGGAVWVPQKAEGGVGRSGGTQPPHVAAGGLAERARPKIPGGFGTVCKVICID